MFFSSMGPSNSAGCSSGSAFEPLGQADPEVLSLKTTLFLALPLAKRAIDLCTLHFACLTVMMKGVIGTTSKSVLPAKFHHLLVYVKGHSLDCFPPSSCQRGGGAPSRDCLSAKEVGLKRPLCRCNGSLTGSVMRSAGVMR